MPTKKKSQFTQAENGWILFLNNEKSKTQQGQICILELKGVEEMALSMIVEKPWNGGLPQSKETPREV